MNLPRTGLDAPRTLGPEDGVRLQPGPVRMTLKVTSELAFRTSRRAFSGIYVTGL